MTDFDRVFDDCLIQISSGASTLDECLARHPEHAAQLRPLLQTASRLERGREVRPSPAFKARTRAQLTLHMRAHPRRRPLSLSFFRIGFAFTVLMLTFLVSGTALAQSALPGDFLYEWKLTSEQLWRANASDPLTVDLALSERRVDEMLAVSSDADAYARALEGYLEVLARLTVQTDADALARVLPVLESQQERLAQSDVSVPELDIQLAPPTPLPVPIPAPLPVPTSIPELLPDLEPLPLPIPALELPDLLKKLFR